MITHIIEKDKTMTDEVYPKGSYYLGGPPRPLKLLTPITENIWPVGCNVDDVPRDFLKTRNDAIDYINKHNVDIFEMKNAACLRHYKNVYLACCKMNDKPIEYGPPEVWEYFCLYEKD